MPERPRKLDEGDRAGRAGPDHADRPPLTATHASEVVSEIDVRAGDGLARVPFSVVLSDDGDVVVFSFLPGGGSVLDRFAPDGAHLQVLAKFEPGHERGRLSGPAGVASDGAGNLYVPDSDRCCIVKFSPTGELVDEFGQEGTAEGELRGPRDVDAAADGAMIIADTENHRVQIWEPDGTVRACFGAEEDEDEESAYLESGSGEGEFHRPYGVTFDEAGALWVADTNNHRVQRLSMTDGFEHAFGHVGEEAGALHYPIDLRIDSAGRAVVADEGGRRIQWFSTDGKLERALLLVEAMPEGTSFADVDVDDDGIVYVPVGPIGKVFRVRAGEPKS